MVLNESASATEHSEKILEHIRGVATVLFWRFSTWQLSQTYKASLMASTTNGFAFQVVPSLAR